MWRLLGIDKSRTSPYHLQGNGQVERHNSVIADVISKYCADNPKTRGTVLPFLNFVYNTTIHRTTGATPFNLVHGRSASILLISSTANHTTSYPHRTVSWSGWTGNFSARELLGTNQRRQKDQYRKRVHGSYSMGDKVWVWAKEKIKSKKFFLPWEGSYVVLAKVSKVNYKVAKLTTPGKIRFLHFNMLKPYVEEEPRPDEADSSKRPTPFRSTGFFDEPGVQNEDLESVTGVQHEIRPI